MRVPSGGGHAGAPVGAGGVCWFLSGLGGRATKGSIESTGDPGWDMAWGS